jgi:putative membrane protein
MVILDHHGMLPAKKMALGHSETMCPDNIYYNAMKISLFFAKVKTITAPAKIGQLFVTVTCNLKAKTMKKLTMLTLAAVVACLIQACSGHSDSKEKADSANAVQADSTQKDSTALAAVDKDDAQFAVAAANGGMAEVELGQLAQQKAVNSKVKDFGAMMVADHSKANAEMVSLAKSKGISLPTAIDSDEQKVKDELSSKAGTDFDKAYVSRMIDDHQMDIKEFEDASKTCKDANLKAFAVKTLLVLKMHLESIQKIHDSMK